MYSPTPSGYLLVAGAFKALFKIIHRGVIVYSTELGGVSRTGVALRADGRGGKLCTVAAAFLLGQWIADRWLYGAPPPPAMVKSH